MGRPERAAGIAPAAALYHTLWGAPKKVQRIATKKVQLVAAPFRVAFRCAMQWVPGPAAPLCNWRSPTPQCTPFVCANILRAPQMVQPNSNKNPFLKMAPTKKCPPKKKAQPRATAPTWGAIANVAIQPPPRKCRNTTAHRVEKHGTVWGFTHIAQLPPYLSRSSCSN